MGEISAANLKWYQSTTWTEGDSHGGAIDTGNAITTGTANNIFDDVSDAERVSGVTDYRKIFFRNENTDDYTGTKIWIEANTPATNDEIFILMAGSKSTVGTPVALTQTTMGFTNGSTAVTGSGTSFLTELRPGEKIYNSTDDAESDGVAIASIESDTALTLASNYLGTTNSGCTGYVAGLDQCTFVQPTSSAHADVLSAGTLVEDASVGICIKRVVSAAGESGYSDNTFTLKAVNT